jgi:hypothetical protein
LRFGENKGDQTNATELEKEFLADELNSELLLKLARRTFEQEAESSLHLSKLTEQLQKWDTMKAHLDTTEKSLEAFKNINQQNKENLQKLKAAYDEQVLESKRILERGQK